MGLAIELAQKGYPNISPNPPVGCVVFKKNKILATGYHKAYGGPHAEVVALSKLTKSQLKGSTILTTLEPCAHHGKTPSCAKLISSLPIKSLIYGVKDKTKKARGGASIIKRSGIEVIRYKNKNFEEKLNELYEVFFFKQKRAFVAIKLALSLDGFMCDRFGKSKWITNKKLRSNSTRLRKMYDATLIGVNTFFKRQSKIKY